MITNPDGVVNPDEPQGVDPQLFRQVVDQITFTNNTNLPTPVEDTKNALVDERKATGKLIADLDGEVTNIENLITQLETARDRKIAYRNELHTVYDAKSKALFELDYGANSVRKAKNG